VDEPGFLAERQRPHGGMQPIGAHRQVEAARRAPLEGDRDIVVALRDAGDGVVEDILDVIPVGRVEDADQIAAQDLDVGDRAA